MGAKGSESTDLRNDVTTWIMRKLNQMGPIEFRSLVVWPLNWMLIGSKCKPGNQVLNGIFLPIGPHFSSYSLHIMFLSCGKCRQHIYRLILGFHFRMLSLLALIILPFSYIYIFFVEYGDSLVVMRFSAVQSCSFFPSIVTFSTFYQQLPLGALHQQFH